MSLGVHDATNARISRGTGNKTCCLRLDVFCSEFYFEDGTLFRIYQLSYWPMSLLQAFEEISNCVFQRL